MLRWRPLPSYILHIRANQSKSEPTKPTKAAQLRPSGNEMDVASGLHVMAIALGDTGLSIEVVTDPLNNRFAYSIGNSLWGASIELCQWVAKGEGARA